ncbi:DUF4261 domain-containing protein [Massilia mucilaginosa]|uniref:DUF4261 domain-containing protein n=1 Tax=Massilia mucilaginosa TaxID=2609282 RepID=UPI001CB7019D
MPLQISMILFNEAPAYAVNELQAFLSSSWPGLPLISDVSAEENTLAFNLAGAEVVIGTMPAPVPWSDLEGPCATSILWPDAASVVPGHKHHALVTVRGELAPVALSTVLTQVTAALMATTPGTPGVFWTNAALLVPKDMFIDFAVKIMPLGPPLTIWVDCRVGWTEVDALSSGFTTGLAELGLMELEAQGATEPPAELRERFEAIAQYLLENGQVINDGDTLGESADEKIRVVYAESAFGIEGTVMRLVYESEPTKKPWWKPW